MKFFYRLFFSSELIYQRNLPAKKNKKKTWRRKVVTLEE